MPRIIIGSSAGSIIAAFACSTKYEDLRDTMINEKLMSRTFLKYNTNSVGGIIMKIIKGEPILDIKELMSGVREFAGDLTFKEIHDKYKWNLNITVTDCNKTDESRLLNYLTSPNVVVWSAAAASSAIPMFFEPV